MVHLPRLLILLFLGVHVSHGSPLRLTAYDDSMCSESFRCGGVDIRYPFYLSNATRATPDNTSNYSCGYTDLKIFCLAEGETGTPVLHLEEGDSYTILNINYDSYTISLVVTDVLRGNSCPRVSHNVSFDQEWLHYTDPFDSLAFFFDCYSKPGDRPPAVLEDYQINCTGFNSNPPAVSFVFISGSEERELDQEYQLAGRCRENYLVPVHEAALVGSNNPPVLPRDYGAVLKRGFELEWKTEQTCYPCEQSGGRCSYDETREFIGCLCAGGNVAVPDCHGSGNTTAHADASSSGSWRMTIIYAISGSSILMLCLVLFAFWLRYKKYGCKGRSKEAARIESFLQKNGTLHPKKYTYAQVKRMTASFAEKLGQGGFGAVYRGAFSDGRQIAVKMLKDYKTDGEDFINEVASISRTSHINVVTLIGFCLEGSKRALIYDYMSNGSLERYAFKDNSEGGNTLGWQKLFEIAVGIARGLEYLHRGCNTRIVHFDIKPHNILLDQNFCPKISDFGLAKLCLNKESVISIGGARGTIGYIAPEVYSKQFGAVSSKSDVYSYGMMVLEMVGARDKNISANTESSSQYFPQWIYEHLDEYCVSASEINGEITEIVRKMIVVGLWCIQLSATDRPTMTRVVEMLEGSTSVLELPPKVLFS
uniref:Uncharacterized protein n=1 Tax=Avena sativa TaxID=4498 RepID=A0ACD5VTS2_AVESA